VFPPLFIWIVASAGEDWVTGLQRAAALYAARAAQRTEMLLYAALPVAVFALGGLILIQVIPLARFFAALMDSLSSVE